MNHTPAPTPAPATVERLTNACASFVAELSRVERGKIKRPSAMSVQSCVRELRRTAALPCKETVSGRTCTVLRSLIEDVMPDVTAMVSGLHSCSETCPYVPRQLEPAAADTSVCENPLWYYSITAAAIVIAVMTTFLVLGRSRQPPAMLMAHDL